jgi:26S proteasome non-ATPase regulatory subunit 5
MRNILARSSSLGRVRVLALIVKLFSVSSTVASVIHRSNLISLLEEEISNSNDLLEVSSVLELFYELAEIEHGTEFLSRETLVQLLGSIISDSSRDSFLRSRAMVISGRLLSNENMYKFIEQSSVCSLIASIDARLGFLEGQDSDECESALEALGQIGLSIQGATLLLSSVPPAARHVIDTAFCIQGHSKQLAALHALANISGETRNGNNILLAHGAEESLRFLIYETASRSPKLTPSGLFLAILQQGSEVRLAAYRLISGLAARPWCLMEICLKPKIINVVTDPATETTKPGMEGKHNCCKAIHKAFTSSTKLISDPAFAGIATKLEEAVRNGPYIARKNRGAQPEVMTADRF